MRVAVVGAGLSGLAAARALADGGADVTVVDKGRSPGGRLATRRIGAATLDHGAQFFTVRSPTFRTRVDDWLARGLVAVWNHGFGEHDGHPRYVAPGGMTSLAKDLARGLAVECSTMAFAVRRGARTRWAVQIDDGTTRDADAVLITSPLPQAFSLLVDSGASLDEALMRTDYDRTIGLLAVLDAPGAVPPPGGVQEADDVFSFVGDNATKGVSAVPALTLHASPEWSAAHWDEELPTLRAALLAAAGRWIGGAGVIEAQVKKWRFATPRSIWPEPSWGTADDTIVLAGDAFAGPRMEGAHDSGLAAAARILGATTR